MSGSSGVRRAANGHSVPSPGSPYAGRRGSLPPRPPRLTAEASAAERQRLLDGLGRVEGSDDLAVWAHRALPFKNTLTTDDALAIEATFACRLAELGPATADIAVEVIQAVVPPVDPGAPSTMVPASATMGLPPSGDPPSTTETVPDASVPDADAVHRQKRRRSRNASRQEPRATIDKSVLAFPEPKRIRDKEHLKFVGQQPCLVCGRIPSDAHHLRFAQLRALGRKVSDEFTVPVCRTHHRELHRIGNEVGWWAAHHLEPLTVAGDLWRLTHPLLPTAGIAAEDG
jgi:hypothetical protein